MLTVLSFGGGQDSTAILLKLIRDPGFKAKYAPGDFLVVMADTGNEHTATTDHVQYTQELCKVNDMEFVFIALKDGFTSRHGQEGLLIFTKEATGWDPKHFPKHAPINSKYNQYTTSWNTIYTKSITRL